MIPKQISSGYHKKNENKQDSPKCYTLNNALGVRQCALGGAFISRTPPHSLGVVHDYLTFFT
jgi:hypothetical protein